MSHYVRRGALENVFRRGWQARFNPLTWPLSVVYGGIMDARNAVWTLGIGRPDVADLPVVSVGGLTLGGSGKTPVAAALASHLVTAGLQVAVLTPGQEDELQLHIDRNPDVLVAGGRNRAALARRARDEKAEVVILDSGFQHRRLARDLDVVTILVDSWGNLRRLPAGPARERWASLDRADSVVLVRRQVPQVAGEILEAALRKAFPHLSIAHVAIEPGEIVPVSEAARAVYRPDPQLAVAGVMWPALFFAALSGAGFTPSNQLSLADHAKPDDRSVILMKELAGSGGIVCTAKDSRRLASRLPSDIPLWYVDETLTWGEGGDTLLRGIERLVRQDSHGGDYAA